MEYASCFLHEMQHAFGLSLVMNSTTVTIKARMIVAVASVLDHSDCLPDITTTATYRFGDFPEGGAYDDEQTNPSERGGWYTPTAAAVFRMQLIAAAASCAAAFGANAGSYDLDALEEKSTGLKGCAEDEDDESEEDWAQEEDDCGSEDHESVVSDVEDDFSGDDDEYLEDEGK